MTNDDRQSDEMPSGDDTSVNAHFSDEKSLQHSELSSLISSAVGRLIREYTGRGPTRVRTRITKDEVFVVMEDALTIGERKLIASGASDPVKRLRSAYQVALREAMTETVEQAVGRKVIAFLSADHFDPDIAVESFILGDPLV